MSTRRNAERALQGNVAPGWDASRQFIWDGCPKTDAGASVHRHGYRVARTDHRLHVPPMRAMVGRMDRRAKTKKSSTATGKRSVPWWGDGSYKAVEKGIGVKVMLPDRTISTYAEQGFPTDSFHRAAFCYEHKARVIQEKKRLPQPAYRFEKPFPKLSILQQHQLEREFPTRLPKDYKPYRVPENAGPCPKGLTEFRYWVDVPQTSTAAFLRAVKNDCQAERKRLGKPSKRQPKKSRKGFPWKAFELIDRKLAGEALSEADRWNANNVLRRQY